MDSKGLVEKGYITKEWEGVLTKPLKFFCETIVPEIKKEKKTVYPEGKLIFRAFNECPFEDVKVVYMLQNPYFKGEANGLPTDNDYSLKKRSPSLMNVLAEIEEDVGLPDFESVDHNKGHESYLGHWPEQGVLMLNAALTVIEGQADSHLKLWEPFTTEVVKKLQEKDDIVWILLGNAAQAYSPLITNGTHTIIGGGHPSPLNTKIPFRGGKYFSRANAFLEEKGLNPINW